MYGCKDLYGDITRDSFEHSIDDYWARLVGDIMIRLGIHYFPHKSIQLLFRKFCYQSKVDHVLPDAYGCPYQFLELEQYSLRSMTTTPELYSIYPYIPIDYI